MRKRQRVASFKLPNSLILDDGLTYCAKRVGSVIFSRSNCLGACRLSIKQIAAMAQCTSTTALRAVLELERFGYVTRKKKYGYDAIRGRTIYQKSSFTVLPFGRFTFVPHSVFRTKMKNSSFTIFLFLLYCSGNETKAFPSLNEICKGLGASKSTVCIALDELDDVGLVYQERCLKRNGAFSRNSYHIVQNAVNFTNTGKDRRCPTLFRIKKVGHKRRIKPTRANHRTCLKPFYIPIIRVPMRKINTGG